MKDWTPEQRAEAVRKAKETRDRKRAEKDSRKAGKEAGPTRRTPSISKRQVEHGITAVIVGVDAGLAYLAPQSWITSDNPEFSDRLTDQEVAILTEAFSTEAMKSTRAMRFFASLVALTDRLGILGALMIVALPRMTRRGLIPRPWVPFIRDLLGAATAKETAAPPRADLGTYYAEPMTEPTPPLTEEPGPDRAAA